MPLDPQIALNARTPQIQSPDLVKTFLTAAQLKKSLPQSSYGQGQVVASPLVTGTGF